MHAGDFRGFSEAARRLPLVDTMSLLGDLALIDALDVRGCQLLRSLVLQHIHVQQLAMNRGCRLSLGMRDILDYSVVDDVDVFLAEHIRLDHEEFLA